MAPRRWREIAHQFFVGGTSRDRRTIFRKFHVVSDTDTTTARTSAVWRPTVATTVAAIETTIV